MWSDNETIRDLVNFSHVADIAAERIVGAKGEPLSVGISGDWGVGKSSMMKLLCTSLGKHTDVDFRFVEFNAWLYQNYDDARAALMEAIAAAVVEQAVAKKDTLSETAWKHARSLFGRVKKLRVLGLIGSTAIDIYSGGHLTPFLAAGMSAASGLMDGEVSGADVKSVQKVATDAYEGGKKLISDKKPEEAEPEEVDSPRKAIQAFRDDLEATLTELGITLVVLIDDLDRCLPKTAIATLESMRLFLFLKQTAFVIAADEGMIRQAVRSHFDNTALDDDLVTNYFDKLIQLPIRVPALGTQEVRAYLMMLFVDADTDLDTSVKDVVREAVCKRLAQSWTGVRVDKAFVCDTIKDSPPNKECPSGLLNRLALAERIAPILTTSPKIRGNPRLIKRFLNTLSMRSSMARIQSVTVDDEVLVKLLLFERCGDKDAYADLLRAVNESEDGYATLLGDMERRARGDETAPELEKPWNETFHMNWLAMDPPLANKDLRGALYVGRESHPIIFRADELSSEAMEVLDMLLKLNSASPTVSAEIAKLSNPEIGRITDKLIVRAKNETAWGTPPILNALQALAAASPNSARAVVAFFSEVPSSQIKPAIVPRLRTLPWGQEVLIAFQKRGDLAKPAQNAVTSALKGEN
ncbi:NTPase KAP [Sphingobium yanoikuyae]|jgi:predicted KAP-like P-loop ATPase|uniref:NTPase KAP n=1 Tax=Sphingobium yanoikuyae TaxID=13690 RepID=A0A084EIX5_SPHYA|nr:P-loop NTPase fold protein [Sphingobium yanoikuyae]KEZ17917.1 NTPase KAP [Sphingobium yanoikuyae]QGP80753.1 ATPase [Sphingobium sp. CAP-1]